jgi:hypothetical protein
LYTDPRRTIRRSIPRSPVHRPSITITPTPAAQEDLVLPDILSPLDLFAQNLEDLEADIDEEYV